MQPVQRRLTITPGPLVTNTFSRHSSWSAMTLPIQPRDLSQRKSQREHLALAAALPAEVVENIRALAAQLHDKPVLPVIGAGASYDCGVRLASRIGHDLYVEYTTDPSFAPRAECVEDNLGNV